MNSGKSSSTAAANKWADEWRKTSSASGSFSVRMRRSVSFSRGLVRSIRSPFDLATSAASARRGLIDLATSSAVLPLGTSLVLPSGSLTCTVCDMEINLCSDEFSVYHRRLARLSGPEPLRSCARADSRERLSLHVLLVDQRRIAGHGMACLLRMGYELLIDGFRDVRVPVARSFREADNSEEEAGDSGSHRPRRHMSAVGQVLGCGKRDSQCALGWADRYAFQASRALGGFDGNQLVYGEG